MVSWAVLEGSFRSVGTVVILEGIHGERISELAVIYYPCFLFWRED